MTTAGKQLRVGPGSVAQITFPKHPPRLQQGGAIANAHAAGNFGKTLVVLGLRCSCSASPITCHCSGCAKVRRHMKQGDLVHAESGFPVALTLLAAIALLAIGMVAIISMTFHGWPFG